MKNCPYCGKKYPDEATSCLIDGQLLRDDKQLANAEGEKMDIIPHKGKSYLTFPDYQWSARDAWKCLGMILVLEFVMALVIFTLDKYFSDFHVWHKSGLGYFFEAIISYTIRIYTAAYFARTETLTTFWKGFCFNRKPSSYIWLGVTIALAVRFFGHSMLIHGLGKGVSNYDWHSFANTSGIQRYFFSGSAIAARASL